MMEEIRKNNLEMPVVAKDAEAVAEKAKNKEETIPNADAETGKIQKAA